MAWLVKLSIFCSLALAANSLEARRKLQLILDHEPSIEISERTSWARAALAMVALNRLTGEEDQAIALLKRCKDICGRYAKIEEWRAVSAWACRQKKETSLCLSEKTKAQIPPR